jgi:hypothetical protein
VSDKRTGHKGSSYFLPSGFMIDVEANSLISPRSFAVAFQAASSTKRKLLEHKG